MHTRFYIGGFYLILSLVFALIAWTNHRASHGQWTPTGKTCRRIAVIFALVGLGLIISNLLPH